VVGEFHDLRSSLAIVFFFGHRALP
jgi:hypothetical protein